MNETVSQLARPHAAVYTPSKIDGVKFSLETFFAAIPIYENSKQHAGRCSDLVTVLTVVLPSIHVMRGKLFGPLSILREMQMTNHLPRHPKAQRSR